MSSIKITSQYDIDKALVGIHPEQHPEAYRLLQALKGITGVEQDTQVAQLTAQVARLQIKLADTETKLAESDSRLRVVVKEAEFQRNRAETHKARFYNLYYGYGRNRG